MTIVVRPVDSVCPADWNVRTDHDLDGIAESIRVNGFRDPIEVWASTNGTPNDLPHGIVVGEGRYRAAVEICNMEDVPVVEHDFENLAAAQRYSIANNRLTDRSEFDETRLVAQLEELTELDGTGFSLDDMEALRVPDFDPVGEDEQPRLDRRNCVVCPECGHEFIPEA